MPGFSEDFRGPEEQGEPPEWCFFGDLGDMDPVHPLLADSTHMPINLSMVCGWKCIGKKILSAWDVKGGKTRVEAASQKGSCQKRTNERLGLIPDTSKASGIVSWMAFSLKERCFRISIMQMSFWSTFTSTSRMWQVWNRVLQWVW